jgi:hypothetical protein
MRSPDAARKAAAGFALLAEIAHRRKRARHVEHAVGANGDDGRTAEIGAPDAAGERASKAVPRQMRGRIVEDQALHVAPGNRRQTRADCLRSAFARLYLVSLPFACAGRQSPGRIAQT